MREILFRGKAKETNYRYKEGEWIYGNLVKMLGTDGEDKLCIQPWERDVEGVNSVITKVAPETIGQYTGLTDKNNKKIFEGDILQGEEYPYESEGYHNYYAEIVWFDNSPAFGILTHKASGSNIIGISDGNTDYITDFKREKWEIIGNIHDNPDLLKGR